MLQTLNAYLSASAGGGAAADYAYAENLSDVLEGAGAFTDLVSLTFTPENGVDYIILWKTDATPAGTLTATVQLLDGASALASAVAKKTETSPPDKFSLGGIEIVTGDGTSRTFKIQGNGNGGVSATFNQSRITALKLGTNDKKAVASTEQTTSLATLQTALQLQFTPPSSGDYYILYCAKFQQSGTADMAVFEFSDGTSTFDSLIESFASGGGYLPIIGITKLTGVSGLQTCTIKWRANSAGTDVKIKDCRIVAIRADRFTTSYFTRLATDNGGSQTTYTTALSQTFTPTAVPHLAIFAGAYEGQSSAISAYAQALDGAETLSEATMEGNSATGLFGVQVETYAASSRTQAIQRKAEAGSISPVVDAGSAILTLSLAGLTSG